MKKINYYFHAADKSRKSDDTKSTPQKTPIFPYAAASTAETMHALIKHIIDHAIVNTKIENNELKKMLLHHPCPLKSAKTSEDVEYCVVRLDKFNKRTLWVKKTDTEKEYTVSWVTCVNAMFGKTTPAAAVKRNNVKSAFRESVSMTARYQFILHHPLTGDSQCSVCGNKELDKFEVDHKNISFMKLLEAFLKEKNLKMEDVGIQKSEDTSDAYQFVLSDKQMENEWILFHDTKAEFQWLCSTCNRSKGARAEEFLSKRRKLN